MEKFIKSFILSALFIALAGAGTVWAEETLPDLSMESSTASELSMDAEAQMPGRVESTGIYFEVKDSEWLNVSLSSSELIKLILESVPNMITMQVESAAGAASAQITISGLTPGTTYHKYEDNYHNHEEFTTDDNGTYTYSQDLSVPHIVFIQTQKSTKFIKDDATGGDCYSIGIWDYSTKTCTLTMDLNETIQIDSDGIALDGNGYTLTGSNTGNGVYLYNRTGVAIKNLNIKMFANGIYLSGASNNNTISGNRIEMNGDGISFNVPSSYGKNIISDNNVSNNYDVGIMVALTNNNVLTNNTCNSNRIGIYLYLANGTSLSGNKMSGNLYLNIAIPTKQGGTFSSYNIDTTNLVEGRPIYYIKNASNQIYDATTNAGMFACINCNNVTIDGLAITKNYIGLFLYNSQNLIIQNNTISDNIYGLYLISSSNNTIYNNNFIGNYTRQAYVHGGSNNIFYLPAPIGGNYWSDYDTSAEGCYDNNGDGFCDVPYVFTGGQDSLPLTKGNPTDTIAPTTTISLSGTPGNNGWYLSDIQVTLTTTDNYGGSGVAKTEYSFDGVNWTTYSTPLMVNTEGTTTVYYKSSDSAGNAETAKSLAVSIDKTPPSITGAATISPNANGWYNTDVTVRFTASDNISGINSITPDTIISSEGANQSVTGTAFDMAGNSASTTVSGINIDKTAPVITITSPIAAKYDHSATINISFTATDSVSGIYKNTVYLDGQQYNPSNPISLLYLSLDTHTLRVESENYAGLAASQSVDFEIIATASGTTSAITTLYQTGAIDSAGIVTSLSQQLQAAQAAISSGQTASAQNILEAFTNMLEAQSGKHISSSAAEILKADAMYMIGQL